MIPQNSEEESILPLRERGRGRERESIIIRVIFFVEKFKLTTGLVQLVSRVGVFNDHDDDGKEQQ